MRLVTRIAAALVGVLALSGCGVSAEDFPLPGGAAVEGPSYHVTAVFSDALNLPAGAAVRLEGVEIGRVAGIEARDFTARVRLELPTAVPLPADTTAELRQATPLGEVFVALAPPAEPGAEPAPGRLRDGDVIGLESTAAAARVEDLLAALSALVNGGGLAQLQTIARELNTAFDPATGRAEQTAHLLGELETTLATLNARTAEIDRILAAAQDLSTTLRARSDTIDAAFADLTPAITVLAEETDRFTATLRAAAEVSDTGDELLRRSGDDIRTVLRDLRPVLDGFAELDGILEPSLRNFLALSDSLQRATKGEAVVGSGSFQPSFADPPGLGGPVPGPDDFADGAQSFDQSFSELLGELNPPESGR